MRWILAVLILFPCFVVAQKDTSDTKKKNLKLLALPGAFSSPETSLGFGVIGLATFRLKGESDTTLTSQINIGASYTLLDQLLLYLPYQMFWREERSKFYGELGYYKYFFLFHGIGPEKDNKLEESYDVNFPRVRVNYLERLGRKTFVGARYALDAYNITRFDTVGVLQDRTIIGTDGGNISGIGPVVNFDTRDEIFIPYKGVLAEGSFIVYNNAVGSAYDFVQTSVEISGYIPLKKTMADTGQYRLNQPLLGLNLLAVAVDGDVPFNSMGMLGGTKRMRGYYEGYFRDRRMIEAQAEFRLPLFNKWKGNWKRFGMVAFGGLGTVAPTVKALALNDLLYTYGGGLRVLLDRKQGINLRLDYALSATTSGFYLSIGEAF